MLENLPMKTIDLSLALKATEGDMELLCDVIHAFLEEYPGLLDEIARGLDTRDHRAIQRASHTIKGTLRIFGDIPARQTAGELEAMGQSGDLARAEKTFEALRSDLQTFHQQVLESLKARSTE
jgi:HPt (histidine-containing phosphotransfer) domain-containing protein